MSKMNKKPILLFGLIFGMVFAIFVALAPATKINASVYPTSPEPEPEPASCDIKVSKTLEGGSIQDGQFTFKIKALDGAPEPEKAEATNDADGNVSFGSAKFDKAGTYTYEVTEVKGTDSSITYDTESKTITVTVTEESTGDAQGAPNNGTGYFPSYHSNLSTGSKPVEVAYDHGTWPLESGYYSPKKVTFDDGTVDHVFCGANYKSASSSDAGKRTVWSAETILNQGIVNYAGLSGLDGNSFGGQMNMLDCVAYLYSYDYHSYDNANASSAWANSSDPGVMKGANLLKAVKRVMYNLYPYNAAGYTNTADLRKTTQEVLFFILKCGQGYIDGSIATTDSEFRGYAPDQNMFDAAVAYALKDDNSSGKFKEAPDLTQIYVYWNTLTSPQQSDGRYLSAITKETAAAQPLIGIFAPWHTENILVAEATTAEFKNIVNKEDETEGTLKTTVSCDGKAASENAAAEITTTEDTVTEDVTDKINYTGLVKGATYKVSGTLIDVETDTEVATAEENKTAEAADGTWEVTFKDVTLEAGKTYVVYEEVTLVKDADGNEVTDGKTIEHKDKNDKAQTLVVKKEEPKDDSKEGTLKTTVSAEGKTASESAAAEITAGTDGTITTDVTDTIDYADLVKGATYKVSGTLNEVAGTEVVKAVATATEEKIAEDANGSWEITFKDVTLEAGKSYVVFEEATLVKDADGNDVTDGNTIEHKDVKDKAQTIVVKEPEEEGNDDKPEISISTEVKAQYISPAPDQKVIDIVTCKGLDPEKTYTLVGLLKNKQDESNVDAVCEPVTIDSDDIDSAGTAKVTMNFTGVDASGFEADDKIVVFEYLYEGEKAGNPADAEDTTEVTASHEDINDIAQTVTVVDGNITITKKAAATQAGTGDIVKYTLTVTNERMVDAVVDIEDNLPSQLAYVSDDLEAEVDGQSVNWNEVTVPADSSIVITLSTRITESAQGTIKNIAYVKETFNESNENGSDDDDAVLSVYEEEEEVTKTADNDKTPGSGGGDNNSGNTGKTRGVKTGDSNVISVFIIMLIAAAAVAVGMVVRRRKMNK